jgi:hypothetical protein
MNSTPTALVVLGTFLLASLIMFHFRKESNDFKLTADMFRLDQQDPIKFSISTSTKVVVAISYLISSQNLVAPISPEILYQHTTLSLSTGRAGCTGPSSASLLATFFYRCGHNWAAFSLQSGLICGAIRILRSFRISFLIDTTLLLHKLVLRLYHI